KKQGTKDCHGSPLGADEVAAARQQLGWSYPAFEVPEHILKSWRDVGVRHQTQRQAWEARHSVSPNRAAFDAALSGNIPQAALDALQQLKQKVAAEKPKHATRQSSGAVLEALLPVLPELVGGSADLTPSNNTQVKAFKSISPSDYDGRYIHFGVREHGMTAAMNGLALHGGFIPYGGTFLQFADFCRPSIRPAAPMRQRVIFIMTHDSIVLGEHGPTHQPVEHIAALRAIPNLLTFRPCDGVETAECWEAALLNKDRPSLIALSRQGLPTLRSRDGKACPDNLAAVGGYVLAGMDEKRDVTLLATGSEVSLAMQAREQLKAEGINAAVVSMPCFALFDEQSADYRASVLGTAPRIAIEAGVRFGWDRYIGDNGRFIGMSSFGASAPAEQLYQQFGITTEAAVKAAKELAKK
ncbi:MAG: transketolase, partial [Alphaproteobacteria bacterium]|nr:transketolase [Alphaproteobacteria bacterium]